MNVDFEKFCEWEQEKASYLLLTAEKLGMDLSGYGECAVNPSSGNTYVWLENYNFCLYMPINCDLKKEDIYVSVSNPMDGEETEKSLSEFSDLRSIENWANKQWRVYN